MIRVILFDFDGVLVDSNQLKEVDAWNAVFPRAEDQELLKKVRASIKETRFDIVREFARRKHIPEEKRDRFVREHAAQYNFAVQKGVAEMGLSPGAREALDTLGRRFILYINSATPEEALQETARRLGIDRFFKGIFGRPAGKPEILEKIAAAEHADSREMLFLGDGESDYRAAQTFGCAFVGFAHSGNNWARETRFPVISNLSLFPSIDLLRNNPSTAIS